MRDGRRFERTLPVADHARYVTLGPPSVHSHPTENVNYAETSLSDGKEEVTAV